MDLPVTTREGLDARSRARLGGRRLLTLLAAVLTAGYAALVGALALGQEWLLFPGQASQGQAWARVSPAPGREVLRLRTADGVPVAAVFGGALTSDGDPLPKPRARPSLLYFYGNGGCLRDAQPRVEELRRLGANVLVPEYPGYGMSGGAASERGCFAAADAAYAHLRQRSEVDARRIVAVGESLGGAVAIDLAARRPVAGLATFAAFTSVAEVGGGLYPLMPVSLLLRHPFDNRSKIRRVRCPILLAHGERDTTVPFAMQARLAAASAGPVTLLPLASAGHNDLFEVGDEATAALREFLNRL